MTKKNGIAQDINITDYLALLYAVDQTHEIMKTIKEAK